MAGKLDIIIEKGSTFVLPITWSTKNALGVTTPVDLTGLQARAQVRVVHPAQEYVIYVDSASEGGITLGGITGKITIRIEASATTPIKIPKGVWDLEIFDPGTGWVKRLLEGKVKLTPEVTRT